MKKFLLLLLSTGLLAQQQPNAEKQKSDYNSNFSKQQTAVFEENKGQMKDQNWQPRPDVLFYGKSEGMDYYIRHNGISYQLSRVESWKEEEAIKGLPDAKNKTKVPDQIGTYRVDTEWLAANENYSIEKGIELTGYNNYYNVPEGVEPALFVKKYEAVTLKNLWDGIDIHYYSSEGFLETDYLVAPGADYRQIQMEIKGADLSIDAEGYLVIKTPFGEIREGKLKVYQENKLIAAEWNLIQKGDKIWQVSFDIPDFNPALAMRIDPIVRVWGTYYGGTDYEIVRTQGVVIKNDIYMVGVTASNNSISTGGHQIAYAGGASDVFLVRLNNNGTRLWGTYYGGSGQDWGGSCTIDSFNNIYITGFTSSTSSIALNGHQNILGGTRDAFLSKFNSSGLLVWGTYYGGSGNESGLSCCSDPSGNIFISGRSTSSSSISNSGHQNIYNGGINFGDAFLVKFNSNGIRQWGTYYGGSSDDSGNSCISDLNGNVYLAGQTYSTSAIAFNGHQNSFGDSTDAFLVKFNSNGIRQWGTYYGGSRNEFGHSCISDNYGNIYLAGSTSSSSSISENGHQNFYGGAYDAYLVKFNTNGIRQWGTYYGGTGDDSGSSSCIDKSDNVYMSGNTSSINMIASAGYQNSFGGGFDDAFFVKFNSNGFRQWGSYYGGNETDVSYNSVIDESGNLYLAGYSQSLHSIAFDGHQNSYGGGTHDAFLVKFKQPKISGLIWQDIDRNCVKDSLEVSLIDGLRLEIQPGNYITQSMGGIYYIDSLPVGNYTVTIDTSHSNWRLTCPVTQTFSIVDPNAEFQSPNFGFVSKYPCPNPDVSIVMPRIRRGFNNQTIYVNACNESTATSVLDSAFTIVTLPSQITLQSATRPYNPIGNNRFRFYLGALYPGQCIDFNLSTFVSTQAVANQTLCVSTEIFPQNACVFDSIPTPYLNSPIGSFTPCTLPWDRSSLKVSGKCVGDTIRFVINNSGSSGNGDMNCYAPVRIYEDGQWIRLDSIRINGGDSVVFKFAGRGSTIRLEVDQHPLHPGNSRPNASVENCGIGSWTPGIINTMPLNDADPVIDIFCGQVTAPLDPNDKTGFPLGIGTNHNIRQNQQIEYFIRFQNVGTDTAFNVVIRDTLSTDLNIFTVQSDVASHPYEFRMYGPRILEWKFNNIMLPDSNVNEPASNGFVKFTVQQNPDLPFGTVIENSAAIYFDFEAPVITNTYFHTVHDFSINVSVEPIEGMDKFMDVKVIPNPLSTTASIQIEGLENYENLSLEIFNLSGQKLFNTTNNRQNSFEITKNDLAQGIYIFNIIQDKKIIAKGKLVVQ